MGRTDSGVGAEAPAREHLITMIGALIGAVVLALAGVAIGAAYGKFMTSHPETMRLAPFEGALLGLLVGEMAGSYVALRRRKMKRAGMTALLVGMIVFWGFLGFMLISVPGTLVTFYGAALILLGVAPLLSRVMVNRWPWEWRRGQGFVRP